MGKIYKLAIKNNDLFESLTTFFKSLLKEKVLGALLLPQESVNKTSVIQTLFKREEDVVNINPFAPLLLMNSATLISQLTGDNFKVKLGALMRSCEIRAVIELTKLKQINLDNLFIIGLDCIGTYESNAYQSLIKKYNGSRALTKGYLSKSVQAQANPQEGYDLRLACRTCEYPAPKNSDIAINFLGCDTNKEVFVQLSERLGDIAVDKFELKTCEDNKQWQQALESCTKRRTKARDELFVDVLGKIKEVKDFLRELEHCRRCYNCRKECPICYCRECIFDSLTFEHDSQQYFDRAGKKGKIRMPSDILLFHLTRMNHMVISCVGCGQCSSACPNGIEVAKFFKAIGFKVQALFNYEAGRDPEEENPQATFKEDEFPDVEQVNK